MKDETPKLWRRFAAGSLMIVAAVAASVASASLLAIGSIAGEDIPGLPAPDPVKPGDPQTILILGSDERSNTPGDPGRSDTTMLLRIDPDKDVLSLLSLPRDLKVDIAGSKYGVGKLNEAYTDGGPAKTVATVKDLTGLDINHVVNIDFQGFADAVDTVGCVYVDVDRKYFNDNSTAPSTADEYAAIDVNAGYQRLCGQNALDYVRYRHTDSDFVRAARQQDFLRDIRSQVPPSELAPVVGGDTGGDLLKIYQQYVSTDIQGSSDLIGVFRSLLGVSGASLNQVHFEASDEVDDGVAYVVASPAQIKSAVSEFLGGSDSGEGGKSGGSGHSNDKGDNKKPENKQPDARGADVISTEDNAAQYCDFGGVDKVAAFGRTSARRLTFPVYIPTVQVPGSCYDPGSRQYDIKDPDDNKQAAYKLVFNLNSSEAVGEYYGVEGTTWSDPPILTDPETRTIDGRDYELFYEGGKLRLVAFHDAEGNSYWVTNTLLQTLSEDQMLAIAESMEEAHG